MLPIRFSSQEFQGRTSPQRGPLKGEMRRSCYAPLMKVDAKFPVSDYLVPLQLLRKADAMLCGWHFSQVQKWRTPHTARVGSVAWGLAWIPATCRGGCTLVQETGRALGREAGGKFKEAPGLRLDALRFRILGMN